MSCTVFPPCTPSCASAGRSESANPASPEGARRGAARHGTAPDPARAERKERKRERYMVERGRDRRGWGLLRLHRTRLPESVCCRGRWWRLHRSTLGLKLLWSPPAWRTGREEEESRWHQVEEEMLQELAVWGGGCSRLASRWRARQLRTERDISQRRVFVCVGCISSECKKKKEKRSSSGRSFVPWRDFSFYWSEQKRARQAPHARG